MLSSCSPYHDDFMVLRVNNEYDTVVETVFKTEFLTLLSQKYKTVARRDLVVEFSQRCVIRCTLQHDITRYFVSITYTLKKEGFGGGGTRTLQFKQVQGAGDFPTIKPSGKSCIITIQPGLPSSTRKCC